MVRGSDKTYGELMLEARAKQDWQEVGETVGPVMGKFKEIIDECVNKEYERGTLNSGSGHRAKSKAQALAIGYSEAKKSKHDKRMDFKRELNRGK